MAKKTLLEMTQEILEEMGSDQVNSISDTIESTQVAGFIRQAFESLVTERAWEFQKVVTTLTPPSSSATPTTFTMLDTIYELIWMKYDDNYVTWMDPTEFDDMIKDRDTTAANVDADGFYTDRDPSWWTTYDDTSIIFDAYDSTEGATLIGANLRVYAYVEPSWTHSDNFTPALPLKYFKLLEDEARSLCYTFIIKAPSGKVEQRLRNKRAQMQGNNSPTGQKRHLTNRKTNYGRK